MYINAHLDQLTIMEDVFWRVYMIQFWLLYRLALKNIIYSSRFMANKAYLPGSVTLLDDWLKRDRFVYVVW